jgi:3-deoxy-7-phosphoheptulonate synthase
MRLHATKGKSTMSAHIEEFGYKVHSIAGSNASIGAVGVGDVTASRIARNHAGRRARHAFRRPKFVSREFRPQKTEITVRGVTIGGGEFVTMARPLLGRGEKQILDRRSWWQSRGEPARRCVQARPLRFPGSGTPRPQAARQGAPDHRPRHHHQVMSDRDVEMVAEYAIFFRSAPATCKFCVAQTLGKCGRPILLKRLSSTIKELLMSAEYVVAHGNPK